MNLTQQEGFELVRRLLALVPDQVYDRVDVAVLPPFTPIRSVQTLLIADDPRLAYRAQDISPHDAGAYTIVVACSAAWRCGAGQRGRSQTDQPDESALEAAGKARRH